MIRTKPSNDNYRAGYDRIFGNRNDVPDYNVGDTIWWKGTDRFTTWKEPCVVNITLVDGEVYCGKTKEGFEYFFSAEHIDHEKTRMLNELTEPLNTT